VFQIKSLLSFPPELSYYSSKDHFKPHTSYLCPYNFNIECALNLISLNKIFLSLEPVAKIVEFQLADPTLPPCPDIVRIFFILTESQIYTSPLVVPTDNKTPLEAHPTEVIVSVKPKSHSLMTFEV